MAVPTSRKDLLDRTMVNLNLIDDVVQGNQVCNKRAAYETTQLINSFLMTLLQHWDELEDEWAHLPQSGSTWPQIITSIPKQAAKDCVGKIRDALAHGLFSIQGENGEIAALHLWTCPNRQTVDWHATVTVEQMRAILSCFVELAKGKNLPFQTKRSAGEPCRQLKHSKK